MISLIFSHTFLLVIKYLLNKDNARRYAVGLLAEDNARRYIVGLLTEDTVKRYTPLARWPKIP